MKPQERTRAVLQSRVEPSAKLILIALASRMDGAGVGYASIAEVVADTGLACSTVSAHIAALTKAGILHRWQGEHRSPDFRIDWGELESEPVKLHARGGRRHPVDGSEP